MGYILDQPIDLSFNPSDLPLFQQRLKPNGLNGRSNDARAFRIRSLSD